MKYVSTRGNGVREYCGIGNVIIPRDLDPVQYIASCYTKGTVSITLENGGIVDNVLITKSAIKDLEFPDQNNYKALGSQVVWLNLPKRNQPIIVGIFNKNNEFVDLTQTGDVFGKSSTNGTAKIMADSDSGVIIVNCTSTTENNGDIYIIATNQNSASSGQAQLNVQIAGAVNINTPNFNVDNTEGFTLTIEDPSVDNGVTTISYVKGTGWSYTDEFNNQWYINKDNFQIRPVGKLNIGNGTSPIPLGDLLVAQLQVDQARINAIVTALAGLGVTITLPPADYSTGVLSQLSNTD